MHLMVYAKGWADLVVSQLAASHNTEDLACWGYSCLCIGRKFDDIIEQNYAEIDDVLGRHLHVFSMLPPPKSFLYERIKELDSASSVTEQALYATNRLLSLKQDKDMYYRYDRSRQIQEKVRLLRDLKEVGMPVNQYADFLFFDFRKPEEEIEIDIIAAKATPIKEDATSYEYIDLFKRMGERATFHYKKEHDVYRFVDGLNLEWSFQIAVSKIFGIHEYIKKFIEKVGF